MCDSSSQVAFIFLDKRIIGRSPQQAQSGLPSHALTDPIVPVEGRIHMKNRGNLFEVQLNGAGFFIGQMAVCITDFLSP